MNRKRWVGLRTHYIFLFLGCWVGSVACQSSLPVSVPVNDDDSLVGMTQTADLSTPRVLPTAETLAISTATPTPSMTPYPEPEPQLEMIPATLVVVADKPIVTPTRNRHVVFDGRLGGERRVLGRIEHTLYVGVAEELQIYDVTDPDSPILVNRQFFPLTLDAMVVYGDLAILTGYTHEGGGAFQLDLTHPLEPQTVSVIRGWPYGLVLKDNYLFLTAGFYSSSLQIWDLNVTGEAMAGIGEGDGLWGVYEQAAVQIEQESGAETAIKVDEVAQCINDFELQGDLLVLSWNTGGCFWPNADSLDAAGWLAFDLSDLHSPQLIASQTAEEPLRLHDLSEEGQLVYYIGNQHEPVVVDVNLFLPAGISFVVPPSAVKWPAINDEQLFGFLDGVAAQSIVIDDDLAYIAGDNKTLYIVDVSALPQMKRVASINLPEPFRAMVVADGRLVARSNNHVFVYDLADRLNPVLVLTQFYESERPYMAIDHETLIHGQGDRIVIERVGRSQGTLSAERMSEIVLPGMLLSSPVIIGDHAYVAMSREGGDLVVGVVDLSDLTAPEMISVVEEEEEAWPIDFGLSRRNGELIFPCDYQKYCLFDVVTTPRQPQFVGYAEVPFCGVWENEALFESDVWGETDYRMGMLSVLTLQDGRLAYEKTPNRFCGDLRLRRPAAVKDEFMLIAGDVEGVLILRNELLSEAEVPTSLIHIEMQR